jgi:hypothetical protein
MSVKSIIAEAIDIPMMDTKNVSHIIASYSEHLLKKNIYRGYFLNFKLLKKIKKIS